MSKIGFVGLGIMGTPMAGHLIKAGHELYLFNIPSVPQPLIEAGGVLCVNGKEVAQKAAIIIIMVPKLRARRQCPQPLLSVLLIAPRQAISAEAKSMF